MSLNKFRSIPALNCYSTSTHNVHNKLGLYYQQLPLKYITLYQKLEWRGKFCHYYQFLAKHNYTCTCLYNHSVHCSNELIYHTRGLYLRHSFVIPGHWISVSANQNLSLWAHPNPAGHQQHFPWMRPGTASLSEFSNSCRWEKGS